MTIILEIQTSSPSSPEEPFWRVWNAAGSNGRGVIGVLEANFIEPAHDKQGFERTTVLNRLEARLLHIQKTYWSSNCHKIGYASRHHKETIRSPEVKGESSNIVQSQDSTMDQNSRKHSLNHDARESGSSVMDEFKNFGSVKSSKKPQKNCNQEFEEHTSFQQLRSEPFVTECGPTGKYLDGSDEAACSSLLPSSLLNDGLRHSHISAGSETKNIFISKSCSKKMGADCYVNELNPHNSGMHSKLLADENQALKERLKIMEGKLQDLRMERKKSEELTKKVELLEKRLIDADNERERRDKEEEELRKMLEVSNSTIKILEKLVTGDLKPEL